MTVLFLTTSAAGLAAPGGTGATYLLSSSAGSGSCVKLSVLGAVTPPTDGTRWTTAASGGTLMTWVSPALVAGVTVSQGISVSVVANESNNKANATVYARVGKRTAAGTYTWIGSATLGTEIGGSTYTLSITPTSTSFVAGDRLTLEVHMDDATSVTMAAGYNLTLTLGASTSVTTTDALLFNFSGTSAQTIDEALQASSGKLTFGGSAAQGFDEATQSGEGTVTSNIPAISGSSAQVADEATQSGGGSLIFKGSAAQSIDEATQSVTGGKLIFKGSSSQSTDEVAQSVSGVETFTGSLAQVFDDSTQEASGSVENPAIPITGEAAQEFDEATQGATGTVTNPILTIIEDTHDGTRTRARKRKKYIEDVVRAALYERDEVPQIIVEARKAPIETRQEILRAEYFDIVEATKYLSELSHAVEERRIALRALEKKQAEIEVEWMRLEAEDEDDLLLLSLLH